MDALNRTHKLYKIQNEAAHLVTGLARSVSLENLLKMWMDNFIKK